MIDSGVISRLRDIIRIEDRKRKRDGDGDGGGATAPPILLNFFVRTISGTTLCIVANPQVTVDSVVEHVGIRTAMDLRTADLRVIFNGRQLDRGLNLAECGVERDSCLQLVGRLRSTKYPKAWRIVNVLIPFVCSMDDPEIPSLHSLLREFTRLMTENQNSGDNEDDIWGHLQEFVQSSTPTALVNMYLSPGKSNAALPVFFRFLFPTSEYLLNPVRDMFRPRILFEFCRLLRGTVGVQDTLYLFCRSALGTALHEGGTRFLDDPHLKTSDVVPSLLVFVQELADLVVKGLEGRDATKCPVFAFTEFEHYVNAVKKIAGWGHTLHSVFVQLLQGVKRWLSNIADLLKQGSQDETSLTNWSRPLYVVTILDSCSKLYKGCAELLHEVLFDHRVALNALLKRAERSEKLHWVLGHKDIIIDFETRRNLVSMLFPKVEDDYEKLYEMLIDRSQLLAESFAYISRAKAFELHGSLLLEFKNEEATGPGVVREWFCLLCQAIFSPQHVLFVPCPNDPRRFYPNPSSGVDPLHLRYFDFSGRVIALALMHNVQVGILFDRVFFLQLSGQTVSLEDIQVADPTFYMSCKKIMEIDAEHLDSDALGLTFVREIEEMGSLRSIELCPGGKDIVVNSKNKSEYIDLLVKDRFATSIHQQVSNFAHGFSAVLTSSEHMKLFFQSLDLEDFDKMLGGSGTEISVKEWKQHTKYKGYRAKDRQICWFWKVVEKMTAEQMRTLLYFWTSVKYLPVEGFRGLPSKLQILRTEAADNHLPTSHTCFRELCLPKYRSMSVMRQRLEFITHEHVSESFGMS